MNKELYLILLWQRARYKQNEILEDIQKTLKISECIEIEWSKENVASNFTRFYGVKLPNRSVKEKECGRGKFLLVTVWDENPKYEFVETSRGFEKVNTNIFCLKDRYRSWTRGGHKVHSTNTVDETNHDITLLLGKNYDDYIKNAPEKWDGTIRSIKRDITGCNGWKNLEEFFYTLNSTVNYCVLRNYEILPEEFKSDLHGDIDLLTDNYCDVVYLTNAIPVFKLDYRVHHKVKIAGQDVLFDFRFLGDDYYCLDFEKNILKNRELNNKNIYVPNKENAFYSLIYHCLIHKTKIAADYYQKVRSLFDEVNCDSNKILSGYKYPFDCYYELLSNFMYSNHYVFTRPKDLSVYYNEKCINTKDIKNWLADVYNITDIKPYMLGVLGTNSGYQFFTGEFDNKKIFIKYGGVGNSPLTEYKIGKKLYDINNKNFVKPILFNYNKNRNFVAMEYIEGTMLKDIPKDTLSEEQRLSFIKQFEAIALALMEAGIVHRDIRPDNVIVMQDGTLKLIDFQYALERKVSLLKKYKYSELYILRTLGGEYRYKIFCWDDMYSINKIIGELGGTSDTLNALIGKYVISSLYVKCLFYAIKISRFLCKKTLKILCPDN